MGSKEGLLLAAVAAALVAAGCGGDDEEAGDGRSARTAEAGTAPAAEEEKRRLRSGTRPEGRASAAAGARGAGADRSPRGRCLTGAWVSSSFVGRREFDTPFGPIALSGQGRGMVMAFSDATWTIRGIGRRPMRGSAIGIDGTVKVNGSVRGRLVAADRGRVRFRQTSTRGTVTLSGLGRSIELPVSVVAASVVPDGPAEVRCDARRLTIDSRSGVMRLVRR